MGNQRTLIRAFYRRAKRGGRTTNSGALLSVPLECGVRQTKVNMDLKLKSVKIVKTNNVNLLDGSLNAAFKAIRKSISLTQTQAAQIVGLSRASVANIETNKQALSFEHFEKFANHCGYKVNITLTKLPNN